MKGMKILIGFFLAVAGLALTAAALLDLTRPEAAVNPGPPPAPSIILSSDPFPLAVGPTTLRVTVLGSDGQPVSDADVVAASQMKHPGMPALVRPGRADGSGGYDVAMVWPMAGQWTIDVSAALPDGQVAQESFDVYVYPVPTASKNSRTTFVSASEIAAAAGDPARELRIVLPQGTLAMARAGMGDEMIPPEIRLKVGGRDTLVIQNNDIVYHNVGPFLVQPGETIRQQFTRPAEYQGDCTILPTAGVTIIVEA